MRLGILRGDPPSNLLVVGMPGDAAGPVLALQLAVFAASMGTRTAFVIATAHPSAARMRAACHRGADREVRPYLTTYSDMVPPVKEGPGQAPELTVTFVVADADQAELARLPSRSITTLAVSSGYANADTLARTALACLDAGHPLAGVFLANADPSDPTSGDLSPTPFPRSEEAWAPQDHRGVGKGTPSDPAPLDRELGVQRAEASGHEPR